MKSEVSGELTLEVGTIREEGQNRVENVVIGGNIWVRMGSGDEFRCEGESTVMERKDACVPARGWTVSKRSRSCLQCTVLDWVESSIIELEARGHKLVNRSRGGGV